MLRIAVLLSGTGRSPGQPVAGNRRRSAPRRGGRGGRQQGRRLRAGARQGVRRGRRGGARVVTTTTWTPSTPPCNAVLRPYGVDLVRAGGLPVALSAAAGAGGAGDEHPPGAAAVVRRPGGSTATGCTRCGARVGGEGKRLHRSFRRRRLRPRAHHSADRGARSRGGHGAVPAGGARLCRRVRGLPRAPSSSSPTAGCGARDGGCASCPARRKIRQIH